MSSALKPALDLMGVRTPEELYQKFLAQQQSRALAPGDTAAPTPKQLQFIATLERLNMLSDDGDVVCRRLILSMWFFHEAIRLLKSGNREKILECIDKAKSYDILAKRRLLIWTLHALLHGNVEEARQWASQIEKPEERKAADDFFRVHKLGKLI